MELFNILSASARLKKKPKQQRQELAESIQPFDDAAEQRSRDRTGKRDSSAAKLEQVRTEQIAAFRRSMNIRLGDKHDTPDPISKFQELKTPSWWSDDALFQDLLRVVLRNVEAGRWKEPTPIQMQSLPALLERRDLIGAAPTGSGKSGAFLLPAIFLSSAPYELFYDNSQTESFKSKRSKTKKGKRKDSDTSVGRQGEIRSLMLAPSLELASQLHREVERLSTGLPGGRSCLLLAKSNATQVVSGSVGGKRGLDIMISTPLRLVDCIQKGLRLDAVRIVTLDECDRLLDAADGLQRNAQDRSIDKHDLGADEDDLESPLVSGSSQTQSFLSQMDTILSKIPATAVRALFSATVTPTVRSLAESVLRNPVDITIQASCAPGGANTDIEQKLMFVGREDGKLLAIRQLVQRGDLRPPVIIFLESKERAQALFGELLYDGIHVDVIHAGCSKSARENAVAKFRRGDTWVLISTDLVARGVDFRAVNMVINYDLPDSGITYVHRIGRCGRAGRKGQAITMFTESDFDHLRTIANIMKQSGCEVEEWMLNLPKTRPKSTPKRRHNIDTTPGYDKVKRGKKQQAIAHSKKQIRGDLCPPETKGKDK
jgi:ATP-dependent RNA helicase DDX52/ROK1